MKMELFVVRGEKVEGDQYKLITHNGLEYSYKRLNTERESFQKEEYVWKMRVIEGQNILLDWIENPVGESPAYICWNYEGRAMLEVKLKTLFSDTWNYFGIETNPYEFRDVGDWVLDKNCPYKKKN